jgi:hypothetical protein
MLTPLDLFQTNPHIRQAIRQGGQNDENIETEGMSEHRLSHTDVPFNMELIMDGCNIPENEYEDLKSLYSSVMHWGQMKLLLGEIDFLTPYLGVENLCVVYLGSAPGHHLKVLVDLMPKTWTWELYDDRPCEVFCNESINDVVMEKVSRYPSRFRQSSLANIEEFETTEELEEMMHNGDTHQAFKKYKDTHYDAICHYLINFAKRKLDDRCQVQEALIEKLEKIHAPKSCLHSNLQDLYKLKNTILIAREHRPNVKVNLRLVDDCEARRLRYKYVVRPQSDNDPQLLCISDIRTPLEKITESSTEYDMMMQMELLAELRPYQATLKFKMPYSDKFPLEKLYLDGKLLFQPYSPKVSHECRLHTIKGGDFAAKKVYNRVEYCKKLFNFQTVLRTSLYSMGDQLPNEVDHPYLVSNGVATDHCYDCTAARRIIENMGKGDALCVLNDIVKQLIEIQIKCKADGNGASDE